MADEAFVNNSGQGENIVVPENVSDNFNWGAFLLTWIWGLGNKTYITLLMLLTVVLVFIPFVNLVSGIAQIALAIWFGIKGNEWAWKNKKFASVEAFHEYQKKWAIAGTILAVLGILIGIILAFIIIVAAVSGAAVE
ncbi:hypothetical protein IJ750_05435 [bacterium]|nr:hypothetical protein [bacterium]